MKYRLFIFLLFYLTNYCLAADIGENELKPAEMEILDYSDFPSMTDKDDLCFKIISVNFNDKDLFIFNEEDELSRLRITSGSFSRAHYYSGKSPLIIHKKEIETSGETKLVPVFSFPFKNSALDYILCMKKLGNKYYGLPIDLSLEAQEIGSVRFVNFTSVDLVVLIGKKRSLIPANEALVVKFPTKEKIYFKFKVAAQYKDDTYILYSQRHPFREGMRALFIGYTSREVLGDESGFRVLSHFDSGPENRLIQTEQNF